MVRAASAGYPGGAFHTPMPPYPYAALRYGEHGFGVVQVLCDPTGKVAEARMLLETGYLDLDKYTLDFARAHWTGQPNSTWKVPVEYRFTNRVVMPGAKGTSVKGWYTPMPPYPPDSMRKMESGSGVIKIVTNDAGQVADARMIRSTGAQRLDTVTVYYALASWHGPARSIREIPVSFGIK